MKINSHSNYETIKLATQKSKGREDKLVQTQNQEQRRLEEKPFSEIKALNAQVAQVQGLEKGLVEARKGHEKLLGLLEEGDSPEIKKKIQNIELKITEIIKKSLAQSQEFEMLPSLYRSLLQNYSHRDYDKIEALLNQTQNKLHYLLDRFEGEISNLSEHVVEFDPKKLKNDFFAKSHDGSKLSLECLV